MTTRTCWVTGAGGLIGHALITSRWRSRDWEAVALERSALDLTDEAAVSRRFEAEQPDAVIHCAAMSRSPACQREPERAQRVNVEATRHLARLFAGRPMVFLSTDLVFDGRQAPYREDAATGPLSVYARTKADAEGLVLEDPVHLVVRTSLNHGTSPTRDRGFNEDMERAWAEGRSLSLFVDEFRCPLGAEVTARALWRLLEVGARGIVHVAGRERLSRWEIGCLLAGGDARRRALVQTASLKDFPGAPRSPDTTLDVSRAEALMGWALPRYSEWLGQAR